MPEHITKSQSQPRYLTRLFELEKPTATSDLTEPGTRVEAIGYSADGAVLVVRHYEVAQFSAGQPHRSSLELVRLGKDSLFACPEADAYEIAVELAAKASAVAKTDTSMLRERTVPLMDVQLTHTDGATKFERSWHLSELITPAVAARAGRLAHDHGIDVATEFVTRACEVLSAQRFEAAVEQHLEQIERYAAEQAKRDQIVESALRAEGLLPPRPQKKKR